MRWWLPRVELAFALLCMALSLAPNAAAQATTGSIGGRVTDPSKAVVVGAVVTAVSESTGVSYTERSNKDGDFEVPALPPGTYTVTVTQPGFQTAVAKNLLLVYRPETCDQF